MQGMQFIKLISITSRPWQSAETANHILLCLANHAATLSGKTQTHLCRHVAAIWKMLLVAFVLQHLHHGLGNHQEALTKAEVAGAVRQLSQQLRSAVYSSGVA